jgi:hypothetical protein
MHYIIHTYIHTFILLMMQSEFAGLRYQYARTVVSSKQSREDREKRVVSSGAVSHMNYIAPKDSSQRLNEIKAKAVGKSSVSDTSATKNYSHFASQSALRRLRRGGYAAPPKKGAVVNPFGRG